MANELYILDQDDKLLTVLPPEIIIKAPFREELNQVSDQPLSITIDSNAEQSQYVVEENQVVFRDKEGDLRLYRIKEIDDIDNANETQTTAICQPSFMELAKHTVEDRRMVDDTAQVALDAALDGTRWTGIVDVSLGTATQNFYYISSVDAIWKILEVWGGDFKDVVTFDGNKIISREIHIKQRLGSDAGKRFEIDHDIEEIQRTVLSYPVTALYGRGASLQTEGGGYTRYIDFADAVWSKAKGDPVDKPKGQKWVGDPNALQRFGLQHNGKLLHLDEIVQNQDIEDPKELLQWTWEQLQYRIENGLEVNYQLKVQLLEQIAGYEHEKVSLGDTTRAIDRKFSRPIEIQARVIALEYDLMNIEDTAIVEMGQFLNLDDDRLDRVIEDLNNNRGKWEHPIIDRSNYPDKIPSVPTNVQAVGGFKTIQLYWDYPDELFIKHYEIYGSQVQGIIPTSAHLLGRGDVSAFAHEVDTDQVWYYRIRAVNHHGRGSDYSNEVTASTVRIISDDILFGVDIAAKLRGLSEIAPILADGSLTFDQFSEQVKTNDGTRIKGDLIAVEGTTYIADGVIGNAAIANAAIDKAKLGTAVVGTAQIEDAAITNAKIYEVTADKVRATSLDAISANLGTVTAGVLRSKNNNMELNLNTGNLSMQNANFTLGGGADIYFNDPGNKLYYNHYDPVGNIRRSAGVGFGTSINDRFPYAFLGTTNTSRPSARDDMNFTGFIVNTKQRMLTDGIGNSVVGDIFHIRDQAVSFSKGLRFDLSGNRITIHPMSSGTYDYDLGTPNGHFQRAYLQSIRSDNGFIRFRNSSEAYDHQGFTMETTYGTDRHLHFRGTTSGDFWNLGKPGGWRFSYVYLNYQPDVSSDARLKEDIHHNTLGLDFINDLETKSFKLINNNPYVLQEPTQYGLLAQQLRDTLIAHGVNINEINMISQDENGMYGVAYTQLISPIIKAIQELANEVETLKGAV